MISLDSPQSDLEQLLACSKPKFGPFRSLDRLSQIGLVYFKSVVFNQWFASEPNWPWGNGVPVDLDARRTAIQRCRDSIGRAGQYAESSRYGTARLDIGDLLRLYESVKDVKVAAEGRRLEQLPYPVWADLPVVLSETDLIGDGVERLELRLDLGKTDVSVLWEVSPES